MRLTRACLYTCTTGVQLLLQMMQQASLLEFYGSNTGSSSASTDVGNELLDSDDSNGDEPPPAHGTAYLSFLIPPTFMILWLQP